MEANVSQNFSLIMESFGTVLQTLFIVPELINVTCFLLGIYGMYHGIEIQHPLYAILFFNLIVPLISSTVNLSVVGFSSFETYLKVSNLTNWISIYFHGTSWLLSSLIRYVYIMHKDWLFSKFPDVKKQGWIALGLDIALTLLLILPTVGSAILLGNYKFLLLLEFRCY